MKNIKLKKYMSEKEMEEFLEKQGYNVRINGKIKRYLVDECAIKLGYLLDIDEERLENMFVLNS